MARKGGRGRGRHSGRSGDVLRKAIGGSGAGVYELSRTGARTAGAPTVSLDGAVQAMTRGSLDPSGNYAPATNYPRDPLDTGPFGPLWPLHVQAINPPRADTGQPEPRVWEYPTGFNLPGTGDRLLPWAVLRAASTNVDVIRRCIEIRKDDVRTLEGSWNVSEKAIKSAQEADPTKPRDEIEAALRKEFADDIERLTGFWERPWITNGVRFGQWVAAVMEDHIVLDAVAIYPVTTVGGDVIAFRVVDGSTIKLLINLDGERPQPPYAAFQQILEGFPRGEYLSDVVLTEDGTEDTSSAFTARQITYWRENFRTFTPYGNSQVEQALVSAALYLKRQGWMHSEYDEGSTPLTWLIPEGDKFVASQLSPTQRREYETAINDDMEGQTGKRHRIKVSYPGFKPEQMSSVDERYKPEYDRFLVNMLIGHMGVTMDRFGLTETKGLGATGQHERQAEVQDDSGVNPDVKMIQDLVLELSRNYLDSPLELAFTLTKSKTEDEAAKSTMLDQQRKRGTITQNEDRKASGLQPLAMAEADMPSMVTATGVVYLEGGAQKQAEMDAAAVELAKNPPVPGSTPGAPGRGPAGGSGGTGGSKPKPSGPKPAGPTGAPRNKSPELRAFTRWFKSLGGKPPARPFRFENCTPEDVSLAYDHDFVPMPLHGDYMAFEGYEWRQDITKDWRAWNAAHPLHPRGPHGRFVKVGNLVDELQRTRGGPLSDLHESELDEAARRTAAGRHIRRGQSQLADDLERYGLLEEYGGRGGNKGRLEISEAGRLHLRRRDEGGGDIPPVLPDPVDPPDPPGVQAARARQERVDAARAFASQLAEMEEMLADQHDTAEITARARSAADREPKMEHLAAFATITEGHHGDRGAMLASARMWGAEHGLTAVGTPGEAVTYDPAVHAAPGWMQAEMRERGISRMEIVKPGYTWTDPVSGDQVRMSKPAVDFPMEGAATPPAEPVLPNPKKTRVPVAPKKRFEDMTEDELRAESEERRARLRAIDAESIARTGKTPTQAEILADLEGRRSDAALEAATAAKPSSRDTDAEPQPTPAQRREQLRAERLAAREQRRGITAAPEPTSHGQPTDDPGTVAGMTDINPPEAPDVPGREVSVTVGPDGAAHVEDIAEPTPAPFVPEFRPAKLTTRQIGTLASADNDSDSARGTVIGEPRALDALEGHGLIQRTGTRMGRITPLGRQTLEHHQRLAAGIQSKPDVDPAAVRAQLLEAPSREEAGRIIDDLGLTVPQLKRLAADMGVTLGSKTTKQRARDMLVSLTTGRRLDSLAIFPGPSAPRATSRSGHHTVGGDSVDSMIDTIRRYDSGYSARTYLEDFSTPEKRVEIARRLGIENPDDWDDTELVAQIMAVARARQKAEINSDDQVAAEAKRAEQRAAGRARRARDKARVEIEAPKAPSADERQIQTQTEHMRVLRRSLTDPDLSAAERERALQDIAALGRQIDAAQRRMKRGR